MVYTQWQLPVAAGLTAVVLYWSLTVLAQRDTFSLAVCVGLTLLNC